MRPCLTIDVEDWYDGMADLGHPVHRHGPRQSGLDALLELLAAAPPDGAHQLTFFVVGRYAPEVAGQLQELVAAGHEVASHSPDHTEVPEDPAQLEGWLRQGREQLEAVVQRPVRGFRSPRFDVPQTMPLEKYREILARAGFAYVSDRQVLGEGSALAELPVLQWRGLPVGGGSYQRLLPKDVTVRVLSQLAPPKPPVLYYHSYDFGDILPTFKQDHSRAVLHYSLGRRRIPAIFGRILTTMGSTSCEQALHAV